MINGQGSRSPNQRTHRDSLHRGRRSDVFQAITRWRRNNFLKRGSNRATQPVPFREGFTSVCASISRSHRDGCHDRKVSQARWRRAADVGLTFSKIKGDPGSMGLPRFNLSSAILSTVSPRVPSYPTNRHTFYSLLKAQEGQRFCGARRMRPFRKERID